MKASDASVREEEKRKKIKVNIEHKHFPLAEMCDAVKGKTLRLGYYGRFNQNSDFFLFTHSLLTSQGTMPAMEVNKISINLPNMY